MNRQQRESNRQTAADLRWKLSGVESKRGLVPYPKWMTFGSATMTIDGIDYEVRDVTFSEPVNRAATPTPTQPVLRGPALPVHHLFDLL